MKEGFDSPRDRHSQRLSNAVKRFYSIVLKQYKENVPPMLARTLLKKESKLIRYLDKHKALKFVYQKKTNKLECYADEKHLMIGKLKYPKMFTHGGTIGFMELYITMIINRKLKHVK